MRESALNAEYLICAVDAPFDEKKTLRDRGYHWRPAGLQNGKVWWTICPDKVAEIEWLNSKIYHHYKDIPTQEVTAINRYSNRLWEFCQITLPNENLLAKSKHVFCPGANSHAAIRASIISVREVCLEWSL